MIADCRFKKAIKNVEFMKSGKTGYANKAFALFMNLCVSALICGYSSLAAAEYPQWWVDRGVLSSKPGVINNDFAAANQGQVKWIALKAREELDAKLPGGAGTKINTLVGGFLDADNYCAVNVGQLKNVAQPFWEKLIEVGYASSYPWPAPGPGDNDFAMVNIGQVKYLFSFDLISDVKIVQPILVTYAGNLIPVVFNLASTTVSPVTWKLSPEVSGGATLSGSGYTQVGGTTLSVIPGSQAQLYTITAQSQNQTYNFYTSEFLVVKPDRVVVVGGAGDSASGPGNSPLNRVVLGGYKPVTFKALMEPATPENKGTEFVTWKVLDGKKEGDKDGDGISDTVDTDPAVKSIYFRDTTLGGKTSGKISKRGDRVFQIYDSPNADKGVRIIVSSGNVLAEISTTGIIPAVIVTIAPGKSADFELGIGTVEIELFSGELEATAVGIDTSISALMTDQSFLTFDLVNSGELQVSTPLDSENPPLVSINDGERIPLQAGESMTAEFTSDIDGDGVLDGIDEKPDSDMSPTVVIGGLDSGVRNVVDEKGWTVSDRITLFAEGAGNHGAFVENVVKLANELESKGLLTNKEAADLKNTAAKSDVGQVK